MVKLPTQLKICTHIRVCRYFERTNPTKLQVLKRINENFSINSPFTLQLFNCRRNLGKCLWPAVKCTSLYQLYIYGRITKYSHAINYVICSRWLSYFFTLSFSGTKVDRILITLTVKNASFYWTCSRFVSLYFCSFVVKSTNDDSATWK